MSSVRATMDQPGPSARRVRASPGANADRTRPSGGGESTYARASARTRRIPVCPGDAAPLSLPSERPAPSVRSPEPVAPSPLPLADGAPSDPSDAADPSDETGQSAPAGRFTGAKAESSILSRHRAHRSAISSAPSLR